MIKAQVSCPFHSERSVKEILFRTKACLNILKVLEILPVLNYITGSQKFPRMKNAEKYRSASRRVYSGWRYV